MNIILNDDKELKFEDSGSCTSVDIEKFNGDKEELNAITQSYNIEPNYKKVFLIFLLLVSILPFIGTSIECFLITYGTDPIPFPVFSMLGIFLSVVILPIVALLNVFINKKASKNEKIVFLCFSLLTAATLFYLVGILLGYVFSSILIVIINLFI